MLETIVVFGMFLWGLLIAFDAVIIPDAHIVWPIWIVGGIILAHLAYVDNKRRKGGK